MVVLIFLYQIAPFELIERINLFSAFIQPVEPIVCVHPKNTILCFQYIFDKITRQVVLLIRWFVYSNAKTVKHIETITRAKPQEAVFILTNRKYRTV